MHTTRNNFIMNPRMAFFFPTNAQALHTQGTLSEYPSIMHATLASLNRERTYNIRQAISNKRKHGPYNQERGKSLRHKQQPPF